MFSDIKSYIETDIIFHDIKTPNTLNLKIIGETVGETF
jgi:hypothetical protein